MTWCTAWTVGRLRVLSGSYPTSKDGQLSSHKLQSFLRGHLDSVISHKALLKVLYHAA